MINMENLAWATNHSLTGIFNIDFEPFEPGRKDSQTIWPSGRFHALNILPSEERVITSETIQCTLIIFKAGIGRLLYQIYTKIY